MISVFLVDDEIATREGIRTSFPWAENGFALIGEAPDGEIALPMIQDGKPDILLTDIRMPFMDGLTLCRQVKQTMPWVHVVILSGYSDFDYAKQAISLGVEEYLIKPVTVEELKAVLLRIRDKIEQKKHAHESEESLRRRLRTGSRYMMESLLEKLLHDSLREGELDKLIQQGRTLGYVLQAAWYCVLDISYQAADSELVQEKLAALAEGCGGSVLLCPAKHGVKALVLGSRREGTEDRAYSFASSVRYTLEQGGATPWLIAVGEMVSRLEELPQSTRSARHIRHLMGQRQDGSMRIVSAEEVEDTPSRLPEMDLSPLYDRVRYTPLPELPAIFDAYAESFRGMELHTTVRLDYVCVEAMMTAIRLVREAGGNPEAELPSAAREQAMQPEQGEESLRGALELLQAALRYRDEVNPVRGNAAVLRAKRYLSEHFTDPTLMLQDVAKAACMSNSRFSTVFAQETGVTFTDYLTDLRMSRAKELLRATSARSSQICYAVGCSDPHYFSYLFRKHVGMTPSEYRTQHQNELKSNENEPSLTEG